MEHYELTASLHSRNVNIDPFTIRLSAVSVGHVDLVRTKLRMAGFKVSRSTRVHATANQADGHGHDELASS